MKGMRWAIVAVVLVIAACEGTAAHDRNFHERIQLLGVLAERASPEIREKILEGKASLEKKYALIPQGPGRGDPLSRLDALAAYYVSVVQQVVASGGEIPDFLTKKESVPEVDKDED